MATTTTRFAGFADVSPAQLREAIVPEDVDQFDAGYRAALNTAAETLMLDKLESFLEHWRRVAWCQTDAGHDRWRAMLTEADRRLAGGPPPQGMVSQEEIAALIQARLGR
ncbi:MAG: DUF6247 family protein [Pseudonocardiaceae bacterium]